MQVTVGRCPLNRATSRKRLSTTACSAVHVRNYSHSTADTR